MSEPLSYPTVEDSWKIVQNNLETTGSNLQQIQSFDLFVNEQFPKAVFREFAKVSACVGVDLNNTIECRITNVVVKKPLLLSNDIDVPTGGIPKATGKMARLLRSSLVSAVYVTLQLTYKKKHHEVKNILLCYLPLMVGCQLTLPRKKLDLCDDAFFVINGNEKILIPQESKAQRRLHFVDKRCMFKCAGTSSWSLELRKEFIDVTSKYGRCSLACIFAYFEFPLSLIFPLSVRIETESYTNNSSPEEFNESFRTVFPTSSSVSLELLFGTHDKLWLSQLSYMGKCLSKRPPPSDRDAMKNKRVEMPCELLMSVTERSLRRLTNSFSRRMVSYIDKNPTKDITKGVQRAIDSRILTEGFFYSLSTGNFCASFTQGVRTGVSQQRTAYNFASKLSQSRKIQSGDPARSILGQREVRGDHFGYLSLYETQEGKTCGTSKSFATLTSVSRECDESIFVECINEMKILTFSDKIQIDKPSIIFINGAVKFQLTGKQSIISLKENMLRYRRCGIIDFGVSIILQGNNLYLRSDAGRIVRPLFVLENVQNHLETSLRDFTDESFRELLLAGIIEFIDSEEEGTTHVAQSFQTLLPETTHVELHPTLCLGMNTNIYCPFASTNQGPRITYSTCMSKQSQSEIPIDFKYSTKSRGHSLYYGQKALASTRLSKLEQFPKCFGQNLILAIMAWDGHNQEDSVIVKKKCLDLGALRTLDMKCVSFSSGQETVSKESAGAPWKRHNPDKFAKLDDDGLPSIGAVVESTDVILAKHAEDDEEKVDTSLLARDKDGRVQTVIVGHGTKRKKGASDKAMKVTIGTYKMRIPEIGDKVASRHAQKGTIAYIADEEDLPFTMDGITPDIIMSPHALPTRMTCGNLLEALGSKTGALKGRIEDATAFTHPTLDQISQELHEAGWQRWGDECMMDGKTGELLKTKIFIAPCYYMRLKHMVSDKIHARAASGARSVLTRQPPAGRSNHGGHRLGEMESVGILASGAAQVHKALWSQSDESSWLICKQCGTYNPLSADMCFGCHSKHLKRIVIPYSFKLLTQELLACGIAVRDTSSGSQPHVLEKKAF
jgi:DNA-directed RNA polymerase II subunit RPB2